MGGGVLVVCVGPQAKLLVNRLMHLSVQIPYSSKRVRKYKVATRAY
jgi:hypothetical protein